MNCHQTECTLHKLHLILTDNFNYNYNTNWKLLQIVQKITCYFFTMPKKLLLNSNILKNQPLPVHFPHPQVLGACLNTCGPKVVLHFCLDMHLTGLYFRKWNKPFSWTIWNEKNKVNMQKHGLLFKLVWVPHCYFLTHEL